MKCKYEGSGVWEGRCTGTKEVEPCVGDKCKMFKPMDDKYEQLGFKRPEILENPYGIRIYIGTKGEEDWCVEIPKELCTLKCASFNYNNSFMFYLISEEEALRVAGDFTELAKLKEKE